MLKIIQCLIITIVGCLIMAGCHMAAQQGYNAPYNSATLSMQDYLQLADSATGTQREHYRLLAAEKALESQRAENARRIVDQIDSTALSIEMQNQLTLIKAQINLIEKHYNEALNNLASLNQTNPLDKKQQWQQHQLTAEIYANQGNLLAAINQYDALFPLADNDSSRETVAKTIWHVLQNQSDEALKNLAQQNTDNTTNGWLQLASTAKQEDALSTPQFLQALSQWQNTYPNHPGQLLINIKSTANNIASALPQKIALLLPLSGNLAKEGKAIQDGFFGAYYATKKQGYDPSIRLYNTADKNIVAVYNQAKNDGANFIVGPLTKQNVQTLAESDAITLPTLTLNSTTKPVEGNPFFYQFGLSPTDEMQQSINRLWNAHYYRVLLIAPNGAWGQQLANQFQQTWNNLGGRVIKTVFYEKRANLSKQIRESLNINQTEARKQKLRWLLHTRLRFLPRRRKDFDAIFIIADNNFARQIVPLLKFYFAGDVVTYAMPSIYAGNIDARRDHDLNNVIFNHMPWGLNSDNNLSPALQQLRVNAKTVWPASYKNYNRLMALGIDSYLLIPKLGKLILLPQFGMNGATGTLYLLPNQRIYRKLDWAQFENGRPKNLRHTVR